MAKAVQNEKIRKREGIALRGEKIWMCAGGIFLAGAELAFSCMPFGLSYYGAADKKGKNLLLFLSCAVGYLLFAPDIIGIIKYIGILFFMLMFKRKFGEASVVQNNRYAMPIAMGGILLIWGGIIVFWRGMLTYDIMLLCNEVALTLACTYLFSIGIPALKNLRYSNEFSPKECVCVLTLLCAFSLGLSRLCIGDFSVGRMLSCYALLIIAYSGNMPLAAMSGAVIGLSAGFSQGEAIMLCAGYTVGAMLAAAVSGAGRFFCSAAFLIVNGVFVLYFSPTAAAAVWIYEIMLAAVLLVILPISLPDLYIGDRLEEGFENRQLNHQAALRVRRLSQSIKDVYESVNMVSNRLRQYNYGDCSTIFETAADIVCKRCSKGMYCWGKDYDLTMDNLSKLMPVLKSEGEVSAADFNADFRSACIKTDVLAEAVNQAYEGYLARQKIARQKRLYSRLECEQFTLLSQELLEAANEIEERLTFDIEDVERIKRLLCTEGIEDADVSVLRSEEGDLDIEIEGENLELPKKLIEKISSLIGEDCMEPHIEKKGDMTRILLVPKEELSVSYAASGMCRENEKYSGDSTAVFRCMGGRLVACICDGMGSGKHAAVDSRLAVRVIEGVIKGGFSNQTAMRTLNCAIQLSCPEERVITADIADINLRSGKCEFIKAGSAPSFVRRSGAVYCIDSHSIPAGILEKTEFEQCSMVLSKGDLVVMLSDGLLINGEDGFIKRSMEKFTGGEPQSMCDDILAEAVAAQGRSDDMTVLAMYIS